MPVHTLCRGPSISTMGQNHFEQKKIPENKETGRLWLTFCLFVCLPEAGYSNMTICCQHGKLPH